jgi:hypothetical protein
MVLEADVALKEFKEVSANFLNESFSPNTPTHEGI